MTDFFLQIANISITAGWLVMIVLVVRLILKKAPKWVNVVLWGIVGIRLAFPFSIESIFSLVPSATTIHPDIMTDPTPQIESGIPVINTTINTFIGQALTPSPEESVNPLQILIPILSYIWVAGVLILVSYAVFSYIRLRIRVKGSTPYQKNVYLTEKISSPFALGIINPKIYIPVLMDEDDIPYVIAHENAHICRRDHWWKPMGFILFSLHWFNPAIWFGYILFCKDIELACDEKVVKDFAPEERADYSQALLNCSVDQSAITACPLAFGEGNVKRRVKTVLSYKKPAFWIVALAIIVCAIISVCFLTDPVEYGVRSISITQHDSERLMLNIDYWGLQGYRVETVAQNAGEYCGDGLIDYDGALGAHRIMITFYDTDPGTTFAQRYPAGEACELKNVPPEFADKFKIKRVHPSDRGFVLYLGSDVPFETQVQTESDLGSLPGTVLVELGYSHQGATATQPPQTGSKLTIGIPSASPLNGTVEATVSSLPISSCDITYFVGTSSDIASQLNTTLAMSPTLPHIFLDMPLSAQQHLNYGAEGYLVDISPYLEDKTGTAKPMWDSLPPDTQQDLLDSLRDPNTGAIYAFPVAAVENGKTVLKPSGSFLTNQCENPELAIQFLMNIYYGQ